MIIEIKHAGTGKVLFAHNSAGNTLAETVKEAIRAGATLIGANLSGADLSGADLSWAMLGGADLSEADLSGADLSCADFYGAVFSEVKIHGDIINKAPRIVSGLYYPILITEKYMHIGCQTHTHEEWEAFGDDDIKAMDGTALKFWVENREYLLSICKEQALPISA